MKRALYRIRQFFHTLWARPGEDDWETVRTILSDEQLTLFIRLHPAEQAHAMQVMQMLEGVFEGVEKKELLVAALLHDIGKIRYPLGLWERVIIVLGKRLFPGRSELWGTRDPKGWARPFTVAAQHPSWGADLVSGTDASPLTIALIRHHQDPQKQNTQSTEDTLLRLLQAADDEH